MPISVFIKTQQPEGWLYSFLGIESLLSTKIKKKTGQTSFVLNNKTF